MFTFMTEEKLMASVRWPSELKAEEVKVWGQVEEKRL